MINHSFRIERQRFLARLWPLLAAGAGLAGAAVVFTGADVSLDSVTAPHAPQKTAAPQLPWEGGA